MASDSSSPSSPSRRMRRTRPSISLPISISSLSCASFASAVALALLVAGCPTGADSAPEETDGGATEGSAGETGTDAAPPGPPCSRTTTPCKGGGKCEGAADCESKICRDDKCGTAAPADGTKNGDETDVDCGGSMAPACIDGKGCAVKADCTSGVCTAGKCQAPTATDGVQNGDETGVDCGGTTTSAPRCPAGKGCLTTADCDKVKCDTVQKKCLPASNSDGIKNLTETGIDCGGPGAGVTRCPTGQGCAVTSDCANVLCDPAALTCSPPASDDGLKNGSETDIDCGGAAPTNAPGCALTQTCAVDNDCGSKVCNYALKCIESPSCKPRFGGDTCGQGEVGQAGAVHESCCGRLPLPANPTVSVGKYEITAGRVREFISKTGGNVRAWVNANRDKTGQISDGVLNYLPAGNKTPMRTYRRCNVVNGAVTTCENVTRDFGVYTHLGSTTIFPDRPCPACGQGCWFNTGAGQNGHTTYHFDNATQALEWGAGSKVASQAELDVKSLNCVTQVLLAAFCAWDGGRLPTQPELGSVNGAWGPTTFPWGATPPFTDTIGAPAGRIAYAWAPTSFLVPMLTAGGGYNAQAAVVNTTNWNPFPQSPAVFSARYVWPVPANTATNDQAYAVAAPGRMRNDFRFVGPGPTDGFYDVGGNLIEITGTVTNFDNDGNHLDFAGNPLPNVSWVGGSFEGHGVNNRGGYNLDALTKYGKQGGRCAYDN